MRPHYSECRVRIHTEGNPARCAHHFLRSPVIATAFSCDGEFIASSSENNYIDIVRLPSLPSGFDVMTPRRINFQTESETGLHNTRVPQRVKATSLAWHPLQQQILASAGGDRKGESWISLLGQS